LVEREIQGKSIKLSQIETEKLIAYLVEEELKQRKKLKTYKGSFAPVTHFFGYQGRSGHPSTFDCSLASTMGFTAGILINNRLTGLCVSIKNLTQDPSLWRCGAVPILSLLEHYPKQGFKADDLIVKSDNVHHNSKAF
jgi:6-phosphofructokinase